MRTTMSPNTTNFLQDVVRGLSAGLSVSDPNKPFQGMGAAMAGAMSRTEQDRMQEMDFSQWLKKFNVQKQAVREEKQEERDYAASEKKEQREYESSEQYRQMQINDYVDRLAKVLATQRASKNAEMRDLEAMEQEFRGKFNPMSMEGLVPSQNTLLHDSFGKFSPNLGGAPLFNADKFFTNK